MNESAAAPPSRYRELAARCDLLELRLQLRQAPVDSKRPRWPSPATPNAATGRLVVVDRAGDELAGEPIVGGFDAAALDRAASALLARLDQLGHR